MSDSEATEPSQARASRASSLRVYAVAGAVFVVALLLAAARVGERGGRLSDWQALLLGVVQGATELLPISSSGHLILVPWLADWRYLETHQSFNKTFDVALHLGTLVAIVLYFWADIVRYVASWVGSIRRRSVTSTDERIAWAVAAATVPAAIAGAAGESFIEKRLGDPWQIAIALGVFGVLLWLADRRPERRHLDHIGVRAGFLIGVAQVLALVPGVSRSGVTITTARAWHVDRDSAARFSFLLAVPVVLGAVVFKGAKDVVLHAPPAGWGGPFLVGTLASVAVGLVAIDVLLGFVRRHDYSPFVLYRLVVAVTVLILIAAGVRHSTF